MKLTCCASILGAETVAIDNGAGWFTVDADWLLISHPSAELSPICFLLSMIDSILFSSEGPENQTNNE